MLNDDMLFLDDFTVEDISKAVGVKIKVIEKLEGMI
jgi:hypothetical protein